MAGPQNRRESKHVGADPISEHQNQEVQGPALEGRGGCSSISGNHGCPGDDISARHLVEQGLSFGKQPEFDVHVKEMVEKKRFGPISRGEAVTVDASPMFDSTASRAAIDEVGVSKGVGKDVALLHRVQCFHSPGEVPPVAVVNEVIDHFSILSCC